MPIDHQAQRVVADQHAGVHRGRREAVEIMREASARGTAATARRRQIIRQQLDLAGQRGRDREAAMADDLGGDALADLALGLRIDRQREIGMRLDVDEARRDGEARGVDGLASRSPQMRGPIAAMRPSAMARSPARPALPLPSKSMPPRIRMSCMGGPDTWTLRLHGSGRPELCHHPCCLRRTGGECGCGRSGRQMDSVEMRRPPGRGGLHRC